MNQLYIDKLTKMINCNTVNLDFNNDEVGFEDFRNILKELFPLVFTKGEVELFHGSILVKIKGNKSDKPYMLMHHQDTVPAGDKWTYKPFDATLDNGKLYGRGTLDTKGGLFCILQATEELLNEGFVPEQDLYLGSSCNEETSSKGIQEIAATFRKRNIHLNFVIDEGGFIVSNALGDDGKFYAMVGVGEKPSGVIRFIARSHGGHASMPAHDLPLVRLGKFMAEVDKESTFQSKITDTTAEMFKRLASTSKGVIKLVLSHAKFFSPILKKVGPKISPSVTAILRTTACFTVAKGSDAFNAIPTEAYVECNFRASHHQGLENSKNVLYKLADKYGLEHEEADIACDSKVSSFKNAEFGLIEKALNNIYPDVKVVPYVCMAASDSRYLSDLTNTCYKFVPFICSDKQIASIHGDDENVSVDSLQPAVNFYKQLMKEYK